jgi:hypothetical protein
LKKLDIFNNPWTKRRNRCGTLKFWSLYESKPRFQMFSTWSNPFLCDGDGKIKFDRKRHPNYLKQIIQSNDVWILFQLMELTWNPMKVYYLKLWILSNFLLHSYPNCPRQPFDSEEENRLKFVLQYFLSCDLYSKCKYTARWPLRIHCYREHVGNMQGICGNITEISVIMQM